MTFDELETWAMNVGEYNGHVYVGKNITLAEVKQTVQKLLVEYESTMNELDYCSDANRDLEVALERGCD